MHKNLDNKVHTILLKKLYYYGVRGTSHNLVSSFLKNRFQYECNERVLRENCKLDEIKSYIHNKLETIESIIQVNIKEKDKLVLHKISNLEQLCNELKQKVDDCKHISYHRDTELEELELINSKFSSLGSPSSTDNVTVIHRISKVEEICN